MRAVLALLLMQTVNAALTCTMTCTNGTSDAIILTSQTSSFVFTTSFTITSAATTTAPTVETSTNLSIRSSEESSLTSVTSPATSINPAGPSASYTSTGRTQPSSLPTSPVAPGPSTSTARRSTNTRPVPVTGSFAYTTPPIQNATWPTSSISYTTYPCSSCPAPWPTAGDFLSFDDLWNKQAPTRQLGYTCPGNVTVNTDAESELVYHSLLSSGGEFAVDPRVLYAVALRMSSACVRVNVSRDDSWGSSGRYGILGTHGRKLQCHTLPCDAAIVEGMIGDGSSQIADIINFYGYSANNNFWTSLERYESGPVSAVVNLTWVNDVVNIMRGWTGTDW